MSNPPPQGGWPRPILDSGTPRRTWSCGIPKPAYISLTRVAHSLPDRHPPSRPQPLHPTRESEKFMTPPLTTSSPYQFVRWLGARRHRRLRGSPDHVSSLSRPGTRPGIRPVIHDDQLEALALLPWLPAAFRLPAFAFWSSCARRGVELSLRSADRPSRGTRGPRRGFHVSHAQAATGVGALYIPGTTVLIQTDHDHRPAPVASQRPVPTPRHHDPSERGSASRDINQGFKRFHPSGLPLAGGSRMEREPLGFPPSSAPRPCGRRTSGWGQAN